MNVSIFLANLPLNCQSKLISRACGSSLATPKQANDPIIKNFMVNSS
jgi:hypothetical protein